MSRKKARVYRIEPKQEKRNRVIDMNEINLKKAYHSIDFRTGGYMTQKDRPRKKRWDVEVDY